MLRSARCVTRRPPRWLLLGLLIVAIELSYLFIITSGKFVDWPTWTANYDYQAEGFRSGHLYLSVKPRPELLAKPNPWDPAHSHLWFWDASLHNGHYYIYWGPLPAVALAAIKTVFKIRVTVGDQYVVFVFYTIYLIVGTIFIDRMARRLFNDLPLWLVMLATAVFAFSNPAPFLLGTAGIYQAAIAGGQAFLLLGLLFAFNAVHASEGAHARRGLLLAGVAWALGLGCRVSLLPAIVLVLIATVLALRRASSGAKAWKERAGDLIVGGAPMAVVVFALLAYNKARFGEWLEFGINSQLHTMRMRYSFSYIIPNLIQYLFRPVVWSACRFPYFEILPSKRVFPSWQELPEGYWTPEPLAGILVASPWAWLLLVALFFGGKATIRAWRMRAEGTTIDPRLRLTLWSIAAFVIIWCIAGLPTIRIFIATMRYIGDPMSAILLLSIWGGWSLYARVSDRTWPRRLVATGLVALAASTVFIGVLLGIQGYGLIFERHNPTLYFRLIRMLSWC